MFIYNLPMTEINSISLCICMINLELGIAKQYINNYTPIYNTDIRWNHYINIYYTVISETVYPTNHWCNQYQANRRFVCVGNDSKSNIITAPSQWVSWYLKSRESQLFAKLKIRFLSTLRNSCLFSHSKWPIRFCDVSSKILLILFIYIFEQSIFWHYLNHALINHSWNNSIQIGVSSI